MPLLIDSAELAGIAAEGALYGIFLSLFFVCGYDLLRRRARNKTQLGWPMVVSGILLVLLATARFTVDTANVFVAFIGHDPRGERITYLNDVRNPLFLSKHILLIVVLFVGDSFVNYRCWIVWAKRTYVVILPIAISFCSAAVGSYAMWGYKYLPNQTVFAQATSLKAFFALSLVANGLATSLLAFRIWSVDRQTKGAFTEVTAAGLHNNLALNPVVRIILESGIINAAYLLCYVLTLEYGTEGIEIMSEISCQLTGIVFSIVIFRVGQRRHDDTYYTGRRPTTLHFAQGPTDTAVTTDSPIDSPTMKKDGEGGYVPHSFLSRDHV